MKTTKKILRRSRSEGNGKLYSDRPNIGDEHIMDGKPCYVIDVNNEGAWFGSVQGIKRVDRWTGKYREYGTPDYPKKA
jgi:hypothetical protein